MKTLLALILTENTENSTTESEMRSRALDLLSRREHTCTELAEKLAQRFPAAESDTIEKIISRLQQDGLLSDFRFVESYINSRVSKGYGPLFIKYHLKKKRISDELVDSVLSQDEEYWERNLADLISRKYAGVTTSIRPLSLQSRAKIQRFAASRGFTASQVNRVLRNTDY